jgi:hypothetical protein
MPRPDSSPEGFEHLIKAAQAAAQQSSSDTPYWDPQQDEWLGGTVAGVGTVKNRNGEAVPRITITPAPGQIISTSEGPWESGDVMVTGYRKLLRDGLSGVETGEKIVLGYLGLHPKGWHIYRVETEPGEPAEEPF